MAKNKTPDWYYSEFQQVGLDFEKSEEVENYDSDYGDSRDRTEELEYMANAVKLQLDNVLLEIGTATGEFAVEFTKRCKKVYALDVSKPMLEYAKKKARVFDL